VSHLRRVHRAFNDIIRDGRLHGGDGAPDKNNSSHHRREPTDILDQYGTRPGPREEDLSSQSTPIQALETGGKDDEVELASSNYPADRSHGSCKTLMAQTLARLSTFRSSSPTPPPHRRGYVGEDVENIIQKRCRSEIRHREGAARHRLHREIDRSSRKSDKPAITRGCFRWKSSRRC